MVVKSRRTIRLRKARRRSIKLDRSKQSQEAWEVAHRKRKRKGLVLRRKRRR